jgi:hypothetical protein
VVVTQQVQVCPNPSTPLGHLATDECVVAIPSVQLPPRHDLDVVPDALN